MELRKQFAPILLLLVASSVVQCQFFRSKDFRSFFGSNNAKTDSQQSPQKETSDETGPGRRLMKEIILMPFAAATAFGEIPDFVGKAFQDINKNSDGTTASPSSSSSAPDNVSTTASAKSDDKGKADDKAKADDGAKPNEGASANAAPADQPAALEPQMLDPVLNDMFTRERRFVKDDEYLQPYNYVDENDLIPQHYYIRPIRNSYRNMQKTIPLTKVLNYEPIVEHTNAIWEQIIKTGEDKGDYDYDYPSHPAHYPWPYNSYQAPQYFVYSPQLDNSGESSEFYRDLHESSQAHVIQQYISGKGCSRNPQNDEEPKNDNEKETETE